MAAGNFAQALAHVLVHEGGKDDDPRDPGGRTNAGITHIDYDAYRKSKGLPTRDVWDMDNQERDDIYHTRYWDAVNGDALPSGIDYVTFDGAVNSGVAQSVKWLQRALSGVTVDGHLGPQTLSAVVNNPDLQKVAKSALQARRDFLQQLRTFSVFGKGWIKRVDDVEAVALAWIAGTQLPTAVAVPDANAKAARSSAVSPPPTAPADVLTTVAGAGLATALIANAHAVAIAPAQSTTAGAVPAVQPPPATVATVPPATVPAPSAASTQAVAPTLPPPTAATTPPATAPRPSPAPAQAVTPTPPTTTLPPAPATTGPAAPAAPAKPAPVTVKPVPVKAPPAVPAHAMTVAPPPHKPFLTIPENQLPLIAAGMGVLLISGLILSWSARRARTRLADALGDTPKPKTALKLAADAAAAYLVQTPAVSSWTSFAKSVLTRALSAVWIMGTIAVNVIALAKLLQVLGIEHESWHGPFIALGNFYDMYAGQVFAATSTFASQEFGFALPPWLMPAFVLYVSMASAFVVGGTGMADRDTSAETLLGAIVHAGWVLAVPAFVLDAIRYQVVTRFARQNTVIFFAYILAFSIIYAGARYVNDHYFASPAVAAKATALITQIGHDAAKLAPASMQ